MTQGQLSNVLNVRGNTISNYEQGVSTPSYEQLVILSEYFGISIDDFLKKDLSKIKNLEIKEIESITNDSQKSLNQLSIEERMSQIEQQLIKALNRIENLEEEAGEHGLDNSDLKQLAAEKKRRNETLKKEKGIE